MEGERRGTCGRLLSEKTPIYAQTYVSSLFRFPLAGVVHFFLPYFSFLCTLLLLSTTIPFLLFFF